MVDFNFIPVGHQILNLSRFWEVTFVCFQGSWEEVNDAGGAISKSLISSIWCTAQTWLRNYKSLLISGGMSP